MRIYKAWGEATLENAMRFIKERHSQFGNQFEIIGFFEHMTRIRNVLGPEVPYCYEAPNGCWLSVFLCAPSRTY